MKKDLLPSLIRSSGAILINSKGKRFCNELDFSKKISNAIFKHCQQHSIRLTSGREQHVGYILINPQVFSHIEKDAASILEHDEVGKSYGKVEDFCNEYGISIDELSATFQEYERASQEGFDQFGKKLFPVSKFSINDPLWMIEVTPVLHHSNGGVHINASTEVLTTRDDGTTSIILGLYAAGECTGGINGTERLIGNGLLQSIIFGTKSGQRVLQTLQNMIQTTLSEWTSLTLRHRTKIPYLSIPGLSHLNREGSNDIPTNLYEFCFNLSSSFSTFYHRPGTAIAVRAILNGKEIIRHYTPISISTTRGSVSLFLKSLPNHGTMSRHLFFLEPDQTLQFMGPTYFPNLRYSEHGLTIYPSKMILLAGGSGISPMIHIISDVFHRGINSQIILLWGVEGHRDLIFRRYLDSLAKKHSNQLQVVYCVQQTLETIVADHLHVGDIDSDLLQQYLLTQFPPTEHDLKVIVCGPNKMSVAMLASLASLGYNENQIFSYTS